MLTIVIQAGGESRRMGRDKGLIPLAGRPMITWSIERLSALADELLITTNQPEGYRSLGVPLIPDVFPNRGALGGLYTALAAAHQPMVAVIGCDMPFVNQALLAAERDFLASSSVDAVVPRSANGFEPFHAVYLAASCQPVIERALQTGAQRVDSWFDQVHLHQFPFETVQRYDPHGLAFFNVNTPEDLVKAEEIARLEDKPVPNLPASPALTLPKHRTRRKT